MKATDFKSKELLPLFTGDTVETAKQRMKEMNVFHLPFVVDKNPVGIISIEDLAGHKNDVEVESLIVHNPQFRIFENAHWIEIFKIFTDLKYTVIPMVDGNLEYSGMIEVRDFLSRLSKFQVFATVGAILVVETPVRNYSLSEMARIIEANDASVLGAFTETNTETGMMEVSIKINSVSTRSIIATFERYGYTILSTFSIDTSFNNFINERYESFMKYLDV